MKALVALQFRHPEKIKTWYKEERDGYWIDLKYGWQCNGVHSVHEMTVKEALRAFANVEPCNCLECRTQGKRWVDDGLGEDEINKLAAYRKPGW